MKFMLSILVLVVVIIGIGLYNQIKKPDTPLLDPNDFNKNEYYIDPSCKVGGCSATVCQNIDEPDAITTCQWRDEYVCYANARCEIQKNTGQCGWTDTATLRSCLSEFKNQTQ